MAQSINLIRFNKIVNITREKLTYSTRPEQKYIGSATQKDVLLLKPKSPILSTNQNGYSDPKLKSEQLDSQIYRRVSIYELSRELELSNKIVLQIASELSEKIWPLLGAGRLNPVIDSVFELEDVGSAHLLMESSKHIGKILLKV